MLRDTAIDVLMGRLGKRVNIGTQQDIINEMVVAQETVLEGSPTPFWFLLSEATDLLTVIGDERVALPVDFLLEWEYTALYMVEVDGTEKAMAKEDWDIIKKQIVGDGKPLYYDIAGENILVRLLPDDVYTLRFRYYQKQISLAGSYGGVTNIENGWLKHAPDLIIAEVGLIIASQYLQSKTMVELFLTQATVARKRLIDKNTVMNELNKQRFMEG